MTRRAAVALSAAAIAFQTGACNGGGAGGAGGPGGTRGSGPAGPPGQAEIDAAVARLEITDPVVTLRGSPRRARPAIEAPPFTRRQGNEVGIDLLNLLSPIEFSPPFMNGRGLAAGDVDGDGFQDLVVGTRKGVKLYRNDSGAGFIEVPLEIPPVDGFDVFNVVLLDLDNDGWLDLFVTTYMNGNHVVFSDGGRFGKDGWRAVADPPSVLTKAIAFGDVDEDGDLDAYAGNWYFGGKHQIPPEDSTNQLLIYEAGAFRARPMDEEIVGETLSVLLSDWNQDGHLDLVVGNDFAPPDLFYIGDGRGGFEMVQRTEGTIPVATYSTMSIDTADFDNDLRLDMYIAQIAEGVPGRQWLKTAYAKQPWEAYCDALGDEADLQACRDGIRYRGFFETGRFHRAEHIERCRKIADDTMRRQCETEMLVRTAVATKQRDVCERIPETDAISRRRCLNWFKPGVPGTDEQYVEAIRQMEEQNVLLRARENGRFENVAERFGVHVAAWCWNALFLDADNDEWQDLYVVNGTWGRRTQTTQKFFFHNVGGERFEERAAEFGLQSFAVQSAYVTVDVDNDGDLDLIVNDVHGPIWHYTNNEARNHSVLFEFRDERANRFGIGGKVKIFYGPEGKRAQIREVKLGGGFHSFNPPILHFGLAEHASLSGVEVTWSTGEVTRIGGPIPANALYTISRGDSGPPG